MDSINNNSSSLRGFLKLVLGLPFGIPAVKSLYDEFAVEILTKNGVKLGYVPRSDNKAISRLLRQDASVEVKIEKIDPDEVSWQRIKVGIYLILQNIS